MCVRYKTQLLFTSVIVTSVATGFLAMWLLSKYGHWQLLKEYEEQKSKLVEKLKERAETYRRIPDSMASKMKGLAEEARAQATTKLPSIGFKGTRVETSSSPGSTAGTNNSIPGKRE